MQQMFPRGRQTLTKNTRYGYQNDILLGIDTLAPIINYDVMDSQVFSNVLSIGSYSVDIALDERNQTNVQSIWLSLSPLVGF